MRLARLVAFIVGCMMMSSCLAVYEQADKSQPHATLEFSYGTYDERFGSISGEEFKVVASTACDSPRRIATSRQSFEAQNRRILAGEVIMLVATSADNIGGEIEPLAGNSYDMRSVSCHALAKFVPQAGHTYKISQQLVSYRQCELTIVDKETDAPPPELSIDDDFQCSKK